MRMVLTTALVMVAAMAWADEPSTPDAKSEPAAEAAADKAAAPAQANATEATAKAAVEDDNKPFKPPTGYRAKRVNGNDVYCMKVVVLGSRFPKEDCRTEAQLRDLEAQKASMRGEMGQKGAICSSGNGACGQN